jgi:uncharacterized protein involved in exopolysaccharide biosynthesis
MQISDRQLNDRRAPHRLPTAPEQPPSIKTQVRILWEARILIAVVTAICTFSALAAALVLPKEYEASTVLSPVTDKGGMGGLGALGSLASELGSVAELAGLSTPAEAEKAESLAVLESRALTERYIEDNDLLPILFASKWDSRTARWKVGDPAKIPTPWKAERFFANKVCKVTTSGKTGLVTLAVTWKNPALAATWANGLVAMTNDYLRTRATNEAELSIKYLEGQAAQTSVVEERQAIYAVMTVEINKAMLARGTKEYAFKVLDPAVAPELPSSPKPVLWTAGGLGGGLFLGIFMAFVRAAWRESP